MFIGHFAVGFAAKRAAPKVSLGILLLAPLFLDVLWPFFLMLGIEHFRIAPGDTAFTPFDLYDYPWSHSLAMSIVWSALFGGGYFAWKRDRVGSIVLAIGVFSHFVLDFVTHRPDMPLFPGSATYLGLGLWNSKLGTVLVEVPMFVASVVVYARATRALNRKGNLGLWALVGFLALAYVGNALGPPPPNQETVIYGAILSTTVLLLWAWWIDRNRQVL